MNKFRPLILSVVLLSASAVTADWKVDLTRRSKELRKSVYLGDQPPAKKTDGVFDSIMNSAEPVQEIVILNTESGFVPNSIRVKQNNNYRLHVVNVAEGAKNVSFVMDGFSEHHATYFGKIKSFYIKPKKEGVFTFQCPETSAQGRLVVYPSQMVDIRRPASVE